MKQYLELLKYILEHGVRSENRTGVDTLRVFGPQIESDLAEGFPIVTTKEVWFRGIVEELLFFLKGQTNVSHLHEKGVHFWDEWADETGDLGPIYGYQWVNWQTPQGPINQIAQLIEQIRKNPNSRSLIVTAWNPADLSRMALPPCHAWWQVVVIDGKLSLKLYQRSADMFLGVPFNIASYALLTMMLAQVTGYTPGKFIHTFGDAHIYVNHIAQVREQLSRTPYALPEMRLNPNVTDIFGFTRNDFELVGYKHHPKIAASIAV